MLIHFLNYMQIIIPAKIFPEILATCLNESWTHHFQVRLTSFQISDPSNGGTHSFFLNVFWTHQSKLLQVFLYSLSYMHFLFLLVYSKTHMHFWNVPHLISKKCTLIFLDWVAQPVLKFKCQLKLNWHLNLLEMYIELIYT